MGREKYIIPEEAKPWVLRTMCDSWRGYKCRVKLHHYTPYDDDEERIANKPTKIPLEEFKVLLKYWSDEKVQKLAAKNAESREKITDTHTTGSTSFAQVAKNLQHEKPNQEEPSKAEIFVATRKRKEGRKYKLPTEVLNYKLLTIEDMCTTGSNNDSIEQLLSGDTHGPSWLGGRRAAPKKLKKQSTGNVSNSYEDELTTKIRNKMQGEMEEQVNQKVRENFTFLISKLKELNPNLNIDIEDIGSGITSENDNVALSSKGLEE